MLRALDEFVLEGPPTTIAFHQLALQHPDFVAGHATTAFVGRLDLTTLQGGAQRALPQLAAAPAPNGAQGADAPANGRRFQVAVDGQTFTVDVAELLPQGAAGRRNRARQGASRAATGSVSSPMHGTVIRIPVQEGAQVERGTVVCVIEAMKMENEILAPESGTVASIAVKPGDTVDAGVELLRIEPE
jgi:acetyl-CoA/propionyl-CoA carboxylase biotin carboxyl carrier protein